jgi:hypothetical protein
MHPLGKPALGFPSEMLGCVARGENEGSILDPYGRSVAAPGTLASIALWAQVWPRVGLWTKKSLRNVPARCTGRKDCRLARDFWSRRTGLPAVVTPFALRSDKPSGDR